MATAPVKEPWVTAIGEGQSMHARGALGWFQRHGSYVASAGASLSSMIQY